MPDYTEVIVSIIARQLAIIELLVEKDIFTLEEFEQRMPRIISLLDQETAKIRDEQLESLAKKCNADPSKIQGLINFFSELQKKWDENKKG